MKILIVILIGLRCLGLMAQPIPTFNRTYLDSSDWSAIGGNAIELNGEFIIATRGQGLTANSNYTMLTMVDQNGELINKLLTHRVYERYCYGGIGIEKTSNNIYTYVGERLISNPFKLNINITKYSIDFDTVWNLRSVDSVAYDLPLSSKIINNLIYVVGMRPVENSNPTRENGFLFVADTSGIQINFNLYDISNIDHNFYSITKADGNNLFLGGGRYDSLYHGLVVKTDSLGNMLWHRWYPELWGANISSLSDSAYLLTSWTPDGYGSMLTKIDGNGEIIWQRTYSYGMTLALYTSIQTTDGGIVSVGLTTVTTQNGNDGYIQKVDSAGNLLWQKSFNGIGSEVDFFSNVIETADGGLLINGSAGDGTAGGQNLWLVKLDSLGCLEPNCWVGVEQTQANTLGVSVYPNPTTGLINLSFGKSVKGLIAVSNVMGQRLVTQSVMGESSTLDLGSFSAGIYFITLMEDNGIDVQSFKVIKQ